MKFTKLNLEDPGTTEMLKIVIRYYRKGAGMLVCEGCIFHLQNLGN